MGEECMSPPAATARFKHTLTPGRGGTLCPVCRQSLEETWAQSPEQGLLLLIPLKCWVLRDTLHCLFSRGVGAHDGTASWAETGHHAVQSLVQAFPLQEPERRHICRVQC